MFYVMKNIKKCNILDSILAIEDDAKASKSALGNLISFSIEHGITGNLWKKYILYTLIYNENPYTLSVELGRKSTGMSNLIREDFEEYFKLYSMKKDYLMEVENFQFKKEGESYLAFLLDELYLKIESNRSYTNFYDSIHKFYKEHGVGDMAIYRAFRVDNGILKPIKNVMDISFSDIIGLEQNTKALKENTECFLQNKPCNNVLLYGDSGTGKSTSIKALINAYFKDGLRIIEVYKHQMAEINKIIHKLKSRPYHYVIYMDDLSFEENEGEYKYLKSIIEGGIEPKPENVLVYATSNRRHLIKETTYDNGGVFDDLHRNETQAEKLSLAYRFGLQLFYSSLTPVEFRSMVLEMANRNGIDMAPNELILKASSWQMRYGSLSGRCAEQFIKSLSSNTKN